MKAMWMILIAVAGMAVPYVGYGATNAAAVVRSLIEPKRYLHEDTRDAPMAWIFRTNGTFRASALTGLASWSATGEMERTAHRCACCRRNSGKCTETGGENEGIPPCDNWR